MQAQSASRGRRRGQFESTTSSVGNARCPSPRAFAWLPTRHGAGCNDRRTCCVNAVVRAAVTGQSRCAHHVGRGASSREAVATLSGEQPEASSSAVRAPRKARRPSLSPCVTRGRRASFVTSLGEARGNPNGHPTIASLEPDLLISGAFLGTAPRIWRSPRDRAAVVGRALAEEGQYIPR